jgi:glutamate formiminotransferase/formiminotetrahydrofolate cyclodeaminase
MNLTDLSVKAFLSELASDSPAPGGGSAAALAGAAGAALCAMAARLTLGREKHRDAWQEMEELRDEASALGERLCALVDEDAEAYAAVVAARRLPKATDAERAARGAALRDAVIRSARVPLETLTILRGLAGCAARAVERGNPSCLTDAGSAAQMIRAGAMAAAYNVRVNLPDVAEASLRDGLRAQAAEALAAVRAQVDRLEAIVDRRLP